MTIREFSSFLKDRRVLGLGAAFFLLLSIGLSLGWILFTPIVPEGETATVLKIRRGMSFNAIVETLQKNGQIQSAGKFRLAAKILGVRDELKSGKYEIRPGSSTYRLLRQLSEGDVVVERVTIPEGKTARQIASILARRIEIDSTRFMQLVKDSTFAHRLNVDADGLEGFLFPETYNLRWGVRAAEVIELMVKTFQQRFTAEMRQRAEELGMSVPEVVTLASIIEGEAVVDSERRRISSVYHNRLKRHMLLQADPTIQYIIDGAPRRLLSRDLEIDSPYNTYKYPGLPPGPICNPGLASLKAALYPEKSNYLYFVANGDGSHTFSRTFKEHLRAKAKFDRYRRRVNQKRRGVGHGSKG
ncbi:MAG: endolytic transglycosylase MltG [Calditrichaeota bacterium]|nr:MAG: endolytic transglycosylase MltG [Calditrichota bacterium]